MGAATAHRGHGAPYDTTLKLQTFSPPADGASFAVRVDPMRPNHIVFADGGDALAAAAAPDVAAATAPRDPAETVRLLAKLDALRTSGALSQAEFDAVRKGLLGEG